jgi:hypothetical protein
LTPANCPNWNAGTHAAIDCALDIVQLIYTSRFKTLYVGKVKVKDSGMANEIRRTFNLSNKDDIGNIKRIFKREDGSQHLIENFMATELVDLISIKEIREKKTSCAH